MAALLLGLLCLYGTGITGTTALDNGVGKLPALGFNSKLSPGPA
jgi:hypothetical protein